MAADDRTPPLAAEVALVGVVGAIQVGATVLAGRHQPEAGPLGLLGLALLVAGVAVLPLRHRHPVGVLAATFATTLAYWSLDTPRGPAFAALVVALFHAVLAGRRRAAVTAAVAGAAAFPVAGWAFGRHDAPGLANLAALAAWLIALVAVAEVVRSRRERAREAVRTEAEALRAQAADERLRIARDLHDAVAHNMSLINIQAGVALHLADDLPEPARQALTTIKASSKEALVELRSILGVLRHADEGAPRAPVPSLARLDALVGAAAGAGVRARLEVEGDLGAVPSSVGVAAYRIIQESLTNVARHSDHPDAEVRVRVRGGAVAVEVLDEGTGRPSPADLPSGGNGIPGMRERAASVGGALEAGPRPGRGWAVRARLPLAGGLAGEGGA